MVTSKGQGFKSLSFHSLVTPWASCLHRCASVIKQYTLILPKISEASSWKGNRGVHSRPKKRDEHPAHTVLEIWHFTFTLQFTHSYRSMGIRNI